MTVHKNHNDNNKPLNLDLDFSNLDETTAYSIEQIDNMSDTESSNGGLLGNTAEEEVNDPCSGKRGAVLKACRLAQLGKQWERSNGVFFNEGRADAAGGGLVIKGSGFKYKWGF